MVAASAYSWARARKPGGGAGSSMRTTGMPLAASALTYRDSGRWMKGMKTPFSTSSIDSSSTRYGPMRQYCSGGSRTWSSIQPLPGRLQQRVVQEEGEPTAGLEHAADLGDGGVDVADVLEHEAGDDGVERRVRGREGRPPRCGRSAAHRRRAAASVNCAHVGSTPHDERGADPLRGEPGHLALAAADVEHAGGAGEALGGQREDLLLVLGVGAVGEARPATSRRAAPRARRSPP